MARGPSRVSTVLLLLEVSDPKHPTLPTCSGAAPPMHSPFCFLEALPLCPRLCPGCYSCPLCPVPTLTHAPPLASQSSAQKLFPQGSHLVFQLRVRPHSTPPSPYSPPLSTHLPQVLWDCTMPLSDTFRPRVYKGKVWVCWIPLVSLTEPWVIYPESYR